MVPTSLCISLCVADDNKLNSDPSIISVYDKKKCFFCFQNRCCRESCDNLHILMLYSSSYVAGMKISKRIHEIIDFKNLLHYQKGVCENEVPIRLQTIQFSDLDRDVGAVGRVS